MRREMGTRARLRPIRRPTLRTRQEPTLSHLAARAGNHRHAGVQGIHARPRSQLLST